MKLTEDGPYLGMAAFCQAAVEDEYGRLTLRHFMNGQMVWPKEGIEPSESMPKATIPLCLVIQLFRGKAKGAPILEVIHVPPEGEKYILTKFQPVFQGGPEQGLQTSPTFRVEFHVPGMHWFELRLDGDLLTKIPFLMEYRKTRPKVPPSIFRR
ncbi:MAG: hypothetical protein O7H41_15150 [Planctomycetota bacterium]|nr:hypothetical protein [Planctomycetota bacterium]